MRKTFCIINILCSLKGKKKISGCYLIFKRQTEEKMQTGADQTLTVWKNVIKYGTHANK